MASLDVYGLMDSPVHRLSQIRRYSSLPVHRIENVAEHSFYVVFYSYVIGQTLQLNSWNMACLLERAMAHDLDESVTGDFIRSFKYQNPELRKAIGDATEEVFPQVLQGLDVDVADAVAESWKNSKEGPLGEIVKFADLFAVVAYAADECKMGNARMLAIVQEAIGYMEGTQWTLEILQDAVTDLGVFVNSLTARYGG